MSVDPWVNAEPAGLPPAGPASLAAVKTELRLTDTTDDAHLLSITQTVNALVRRSVSARKSSDPARDPADRGWYPPTVRGAVMLAARLYARRNSPAGVESFGELGPVYISRNDPDVAMLLEIGQFAPPMIG